MFNTNLRDNLNYLRSSATTTVATSQTTTSTSYGDLATVGPAVTVTTDVQAIVFLYTFMAQSSSSDGGWTGFAISGATTLAASDAQAINFFSPTPIAPLTYSGTFLVTGLTAGSNTFTMKYKSYFGGGATFSSRRISVMPA